MNIPDSPPRGRQTVIRDLVRSLREEPILSQFHDDPTMTEFLVAFVTELPRHARDIRAAMARRDLERLHGEVRTLKSQSGIYGYDIIADAAGRVEAALREGAAGEDVCRQVSELLRLCSRVRASSPRS